MSDFDRSIFVSFTWLTYRVVILFISQSSFFCLTQKLLLWHNFIILFLSIKELINVWCVFFLN